MSYEPSHLPRKLTFAPEVARLGRNVILLKRQYEQIARSWATLTASERQMYERSNMAPELNETTRRYVYALEPARFILSALGLSTGLHAGYVAESPCTRMEVDPWLVAGGLRKSRWIDMPPHDFLSFADELDQATAHDEPAGSSTSWLDPFPLLWAKEGKNRIQMYQDLQRPLLTSVEVCRFMPPEALRLHKSVIDNSVWMLRYVEEALPVAWAAKMYRQGVISGSSRVLPFPQIAVPLLLQYGVKVGCGWGWPWRIGRSAQLRESRLVRSIGWS